MIIADSKVKNLRALSICVPANALEEILKKLVPATRNMRRINSAGNKERASW
jgi:hypothetical protein